MVWNNAPCSTCLRDKRYTWRHDSVVATLLQILVPRLLQHNSKKPSSSSRPFQIDFVRMGEKKRRRGRLPRAYTSLLDHAHDWIMLLDFDQKRSLFPVEICSTSQRPDIVIWSPSTKVVIVVELTCPAEENILSAQIRKLGRYRAC